MTDTVGAGNMQLKKHMEDFTAQGRDMWPGNFRTI